MQEINLTIEQRFAVAQHHHEIDNATDINDLKAVAKKVVDWAYSLKAFNQYLLFQQLNSTFAPAPKADCKIVDPETAATRAGLFAQAAERAVDHSLENHNHPL